MKRLIPILILFVVALAPAAQATDPASYWNAWALFFTGADGKPSAVTPTNKLPVDAGLSSLASTSEGLKVVATGVVRVSEIPAVTGTVDVGNFPASTTIGAWNAGTMIASIPEAVSIGNFPSDQTVTLSNSLGSTSNPLTTTGTVHIGNFPSTQTVALAPSVAFTQTALSATNTATLYTTSAGCESVSLFNLGSTTIWFSLDGAGATVSAGIPLTATDTMQQQQSFSCGPNKAIYYIASNTTAFTILESGR